MKPCSPRLLLALTAAGLASPAAHALTFDLGSHPLKIESLATVGALMRMQDRDSTLVGKSTLARQLGTPLRSNGVVGLCVSRSGDNGVSGPSSNANVYRGDTCTGTRAGANERYLAAPGALTPNGDNGDLNFDKYDIAAATAKLTTDISFELGGFNAFVRTVGYFDGIYNNLDELHPDTALQARRTEFASDSKNRSGRRFTALDYFVSRKFELGDRQLNVKVGNQVLNWGESAALIPNSLNSINPANQALLRIPGFDLKELSQPVGMVLLDGDVAEGISLQAFYQYQWKPVIVDPVGSFFSVSDTLGEGGKYAMLSFAKAPEDPLGLYEPYRNPEDPTAVLGSQSSRTLYRDYNEEKRRRPSDGGQYGAAAKFFLSEFNNGTEVSLYFANYHSRIPSVSAYATNASCLNNTGTRAPSTNAAANGANLISDCGVPQANITALGQNSAMANSATYQPATKEALPLDTGRLFVEYPENIKMYGFSFNTTIGDFAVSGEYAYRTNLPIQIQTTDVVFALLQPGFPAQDYSIGAAVLPGRRTAVPDFLSQYRNPGCSPNTDGANACVKPGQYIRGFERMKIGQAGLTLLKTIGGDNLLGATQITVLMEMGHTYVFDMPKLSDLQFNGAGTDTHISAGIDGTRGVNPRDIRVVPNDPNSAANTVATLRQNPTSHAQVDIDGFGTQSSYGYRLITLTRFDSALFGANIELLNTFFHDVGGVGPGLGQNFVEGRKQIISGIRFDYLARYVGEIRYTWFTGGKNRDPLRDRDNLLFSLGYQF